MINTENRIYATDLAENSFKNIKKSIRGLYEILNLIGDEDELYHEVGLDNLVGLYQNFLELLTNEYGLRQLIKNLRNSKLEVNIILDEFQVE